jgi:hypothetical protein
MPIIPALGWQRQMGYEFEISLGYDSETLSQNYVYIYT